MARDKGLRIDPIEARSAPLLDRSVEHVREVGSIFFWNALELHQFLEEREKCILFNYLIVDRRSKWPSASWLGNSDEDLPCKKFAAIKARGFNPASIPGLSSKGRDAVSAAFDAMSAWRDEVAEANENNGRKVIDMMANAAAALGWPEQIVDTARTQMQKDHRIADQDDGSHDECVGSVPDLCCRHFVSVWHGRVQSAAVGGPR